MEWDCKKTHNQKEMKLNEKSKGLGDTIEKITTATGVKKVVENVAKAVGKDCGCKQRKDALNRMFPYENKK